MTGLLIPGNPADESPVGKASQSVLEPPALAAVIDKSQGRVCERVQGQARRQRGEVLSLAVKVIDLLGTTFHMIQL